MHTKNDNKEVNLSSSKLPLFKFVNYELPIFHVHTFPCNVKYSIHLWNKTQIVTIFFLLREYIMLEMLSHCCTRESIIWTIFALHNHNAMRNSLYIHTIITLIICICSTSTIPILLRKMPISSTFYSVLPVGVFGIIVSLYIYVTVSLFLIQYNIYMWTWSWYAAMMVYKELYRRCVNSFGEDKFGMKMHHIGNFENLPKIVYVCRVIFCFYIWKHVWAEITSQWVLWKTLNAQAVTAKSGLGSKHQQIGGKILCCIK